MSQFDAYTKAEYVEKLRVFLNMKKETFMEDAGFVVEGEATGERYKAEVISLLENAANQKARKAELPDTSIGERIAIARDYLGLSDAELARRIKTNREVVRRWIANKSEPRTDEAWEALANVLNVNTAWLLSGDITTLPPTALIGLRVGNEALDWREQLFSKTQAVLANMGDTPRSVSFIQATIEVALYQDPAMTIISRRAGGRWQLGNGHLVFAPWAPLPDKHARKSQWTPQVESIINEEMERHPGALSAWSAIKVRCEALGLDEGSYPKIISMRKRYDRKLEHVSKFGVDMNAQLEKAIAMHVKLH